MKEDKQRVEWKRRMLGQEEAAADDPLWLKNKMHWDLTQWGVSELKFTQTHQNVITENVLFYFTRSDDFLCVVGVKDKQTPTMDTAAGM